MGTVVADGVDGGVDGVAGQHVVGGGSQEGGAPGGVFVVSGQPGVPVARLQNDGHSAVDGGHVGVGGGGDDGEGGAEFVVRFPEAGEGQGVAVGPVDVEGLALAAGSGPLVEAVGRHQAAAAAKGGAEGGFGWRRFRRGR